MIPVETHDVSVNLGNRWVVDHANLELHQGEMVGLIGPNGAGKSTLMKTIAGLQFYQKGVVSVLGKEVFASYHSTLAKDVAYLPQSHEVHWPLTVRRVVALGRLPYLQPWQKLSAADDALVDEAMQEADVAHLADRSIHELAGGERTLTLIARVLANQSQIILADEPVAGLDPNHQIQVMQLLRERAGNKKTVLVVLHDLALAARFCHKLYLIHKGKILAAGEPKKVLSPENLAASYHIEAKYSPDPDEFYVLPWKKI